MRKTSLLIGCFALLAFHGSSDASINLGVSRPNTSYCEYVRDDQICQRIRAEIQSKKVDEGPRDGITYYDSDQQLRRIPANAGSSRRDGDKEYMECMVKKGYRPDPKGFNDHDGRWHRVGSC